MTTGPQQAYQAQVSDGLLIADPLQAHAVDRLQALDDALSAPVPKAGLLGHFKKQAVSTAPGIYMYGGVGRGKSMLMDLFFDHAPVANKRRVHFHEFMLEVHGEIHKWRQLDQKGRAAIWGAKVARNDDPIPAVAGAIADGAQLLCFDEFQVTDVADAMILARLFTCLFDAGVTVVSTSNRPPKDLYQGGLNRPLFEPFIDLINQRLEILELDGPTDYRLDRIKGIPVFHVPLGDQARSELDDAFRRMTDLASGQAHDIEVSGRVLHVPNAAKGVARLSFSDLCEKPLGAADYLHLAWAFHTLILDDIPKLGPHRRNEAKRFVTLIDALYENHVKLICSMDVEPVGLYTEGHGAFEFERTVSRLLEMQSEDYLAKGHAVSDDDV